MERMIAALEALRHPKSEFLPNRDIICLPENLPPAANDARSE